jgi:hypothetical protein
MAVLNTYEKLPPLVTSVTYHLTLSGTWLSSFAVPPLGLLSEPSEQASRQVVWAAVEERLAELGRESCCSLLKMATMLPQGVRL